MLTLLMQIIVVNYAMSLFVNKNIEITENTLKSFFRYLLNKTFNAVKIGIYELMQISVAGRVRTGKVFCQEISFLN